MQKPMSKKNQKAFAAIGISKDKLEAAWTSDKYEKQYKVTSKRHKNSEYKVHLLSLQTKTILK